MLKTLRIILRIKNISNFNIVTYYFKRLWIIGKLLPDSIYENYKLKKVLSTIINLLVQLGLILIRGLTLLIIAVIPLSLLIKNNSNIAGEGFQEFIHIIFVMNCFLGSLSDSKIFTVTGEKFICIKYMHMNPKNYVLASLFMFYVPFFIYYLIWIVVAGLFFGGSILQVFKIWLIFICLRMFSEAFQLWLFHKKGIVWIHHNGLLMAFIFVILPFAYVPMFLGWNFIITPIILHPIALILFLFLGIGSIYYITQGYKGYVHKFARTVQAKYLLSTMMKQAKGSSFSNVEMKDKDLVQSKIKLQRNNLKGYYYMNAIFFTRHFRLLVKPVILRLLVVAVVFIAGIVYFRMDYENAINISKNIKDFLPFFVFVMYSINVTEKACKAMFYNCDISLLHYNFYRKPQTILLNFRIRLIQVLKYNIVIALGICLAIIGFCILCGTDWLTLEMFILFAAILLLTVFFTVHHLFLYYVFQPYTTELDVKNPFFKIINSIVYFLSLLSMQIETAGGAFTVGVLIFTILYILIALTVVYKFAPKSFRVK